MILTTAQRPGTSTSSPTGECVKAQWQDFDLEKQIWLLPAEATKSDKAHVVPLSDLAMEIIGTFSMDMVLSTALHMS